MKVAIYARVSTGKQDTENQAAQLRDFAQKQGWTITQELIDVVSATKDERKRKTKKQLICYLRGGNRVSFMARTMMHTFNLTLRFCMYSSSSVSKRCHKSSMCRARLNLDPSLDSSRSNSL